MHHASTEPYNVTHVRKPSRIKTFSSCPTAALLLGDRDKGAGQAGDADHRDTSSTRLSHFGSAFVVYTAQEGGGPWINIETGEVCCFGFHSSPWTSVVALYNASEKCVADLNCQNHVQQVQG